jgi:ABC-type polysaccharide/polyol phosphate export permease
MSAQTIRTPTVYAATASGLPPLRRYWLELRERRRFIWHLARTDLKSKHYGTAIGQMWIILDPLLAAGVYYFFRSVVKSTGSGANQKLLLAHLIWGVFFFTFVNNSMSYGARSLIMGRGLVLNTRFPRAVLPLVGILKAVLDFLPTLLVYAAFHALLGQPFGLPLTMLPLVIVLMTILNLGFIFLLAAANVFFRDTANFLPYITRLLMYMTPVLYTTREIPVDFRKYLVWNPLYPFYAALEQIFTGSFPWSGYLFAAAAWAVAFFVVGVLVFLAKERDFAVRL